jgi:SSS family solute:Na+ symporter/sodium/pantothenate symporter
MGQPVGMVRLMACRDTPTLRRSLFLIGIYYALIYLPLVITFVCARALFPTEFVDEPDAIMPVMALAVTERVPVVGGLILAAPYAAAMSAVAGFLLLMSSSLVRDLYQRNFSTDVSPRTVRWVSYATTAVWGVVVTAAAFHPPMRLQYLILFSGAGMACTFLAPTVMALYWKRATRAGALAALWSGFLTVFLLYALGWYGIGKEDDPAATQTNKATDKSDKEPSRPSTIHKPTEKIRPVYLLKLDPLIHGLIISFVVGIGVSYSTRPLPADHVNRYFLEDQNSAEPSNQDS